MCIRDSPHTVSDFKLPVEKLVTVHPGKTYYVWFIFTDEKGTEITRRAVELCPQTEQPVSVPVCRELLVTETDKVTIEAGDIRYVFSCLLYTSYVQIRILKQMVKGCLYHHIINPSFGRHSLQSYISVNTSPSPVITNIKLILTGDLPYPDSQFVRPVSYTHLIEEKSRCAPSFSLYVLSERTSDNIKEYKDIGRR